MAHLDGENVSEDLEGEEEEDEDERDDAIEGERE